MQFKISYVSHCHFLHSFAIINWVTELTTILLKFTQTVLSCLETMKFDYTPCTVVTWHLLNCFNFNYPEAPTYADFLKPSEKLAAVYRLNFNAIVYTLMISRGDPQTTDLICHFVTLVLILIELYWNKSGVMKLQIRLNISVWSCYFNTIYISISWNGFFSLNTIIFFSTKWVLETIWMIFIPNLGFVIVPCMQTQLMLSEDSSKAFILKTNTLSQTM